MIHALMSLDIPVNIYERKGFLYTEQFALSDQMASKITNEFRGDVVFTFENPRVYDLLPRRSFKIGFLVYEFTELPAWWVEKINTHLDLVLVPSRFCREVFTASGVPPDKVKVLRYGFNPEIYHPQEKSFYKNKEFTFLSIANPHRREGIEYLLESYAKAFTKNDAVALVLKLSYVPVKKPKPFEYPDIRGLIDRYNSLNIPPVRLISEQLSEEQMGALYRGSDVYVSCSGSEAFGLCFLESLACGVRVAGINYSGQADFLTAENACFIDHTLVPARDAVYEKVPTPQLIAVPDTQHAASLLSGMYNNRLEKKPPAQLLADPSYFHWSTIARDFCGIAGID
jgi:glycosyltransferase involved in cell wall biosynthesis